MYSYEWLDSSHKLISVPTFLAPHSDSQISRLEWVVLIGFRLHVIGKRCIICPRERSFSGGKTSWTATDGLGPSRS